MNTQRTILCYVSNSQRQKQLTQVCGDHFESFDCWKALLGVVSFDKDHKVGNISHKTSTRNRKSMIDVYVYNYEISI